MKIISAFCKYVLRAWNDHAYNHEVSNAPKKAYHTTENDMNKAKRTGKHINGHRTYVRNLTNAKTIAAQKRDRREKLINEFF